MASNLVLIGFKSCGKSTVGQVVADRLGMQFEDLDDVIEALDQRGGGSRRHCRDIFLADGAAAFRQLEAEALQELAESTGTVLATGGGAPMTPANRPRLRAIGRIVYLVAEPEVLAVRFDQQGWPAFLRQDPTRSGLEALWQERHRVYRELADWQVDTGAQTPETIAEDILDRWRKEHR